MVRIMDMLEITIETIPLSVSLSLDPLPRIANKMLNPPRIKGKMINCIVRKEKIAKNKEKSKKCCP